MYSVDFVTPHKEVSSAAQQGVGRYNNNFQIGEGRQQHDWKGALDMSVTVDWGRLNQHKGFISPYLKWIKLCFAFDPIL